MKISELIKELAIAQEEFGNLEIYVKDGFTCSDNEIMDIYLDEYNKICILTE